MSNNENAEQFQVVGKNSRRIITIRLHKRYIDVHLGHLAETIGELKTSSGIPVFKMTDGTYQIEGNGDTYILYKPFDPTDPCDPFLDQDGN
jgi:hypothetical protein